MKIVVTGATGMLGQAMVRRLLERGDHVVALTRHQASCPTQWQGRAECHDTDYTRDSLSPILRGANAVVHLAALRPTVEAETAGLHSYVETNLRITEQLLLAAGDEGIGTFCQASSIAVYSPRNAVPYLESDAPRPGTFYGVSKLACEHIAALHSDRLGMRSVSLRLARVLGQDNRTGGRYMLMTFIELARQRKPLTLFGEGICARDTVYIADVVAAFERALTAGAPAGVFNVGGGRAFSNRHIAELVNEVFGNDGNLVFDRSKAEDLSLSYMDCSRAETSLGWERRWTLRAGLEDMLRNGG